MAAASARWEIASVKAPRRLNQALAVVILRNDEIASHPRASDGLVRRVVDTDASRRTTRSSRDANGRLGHACQRANGSHALSEGFSRRRRLATLGVQTARQGIDRCVFDMPR